MGLPDGSGGIMHAFGYYENTECEDKQQLLDETTLFLKQHCVPNVGYETNIPFASLKGVQIGDTVQVIDREFVPELRLEARIGGFERDLVTGETASATFGTVTSVLPDILARTFAQTQSAVASAAAVITASNQAVETATETLVTISKGGTTPAGTPKTLPLSDGDGAGTLSVKPDGLYYNDKKLAVETS